MTSHKVIQHRVPCEKGFRRIKGYDQTADLVETIEREQGAVVSAVA